MCVKPRRGLSVASVQKTHLLEVCRGIVIWKLEECDLPLIDPGSMLLDLTNHNAIMSQSYIVHELLTITFSVFFVVDVVILCRGYVETLLVS
jgi:hypothetical protein